MTVIEGWGFGAIVFGLIVIIGLLIAAITLLYKLSRRPTFVSTSQARGLGSVAVVVNPTKFTDLVMLRRSINRVCFELGHGQPSWYETTERDPGFGQAKQAITDGAQVVLACGGDGTVRAVAEALAGTETALGIVPSGTGNILARNLDIPVNNADAAIEIALSGRSHRIDVGHLYLGTSTSQLFLVMAGFGFDAAVMMDAPEEAKARLGWFAYYFAGIKHLRGRKVRVTISLDGSEPEPRRVRSVIVGNVGRLVGGLNLMPDAQMDDGVLDAIALSPSTLVGWGAVAHELTVPNAPSTGTVTRFRGRTIEVISSDELPVQIDGDPAGRSKIIRAEVQEHALLVRVPRSGRSKARASSLVDG